MYKIASKAVFLSCIETEIYKNLDFLKCKLL